MRPEEDYPVWAVHRHAPEPMRRPSYRWTILIVGPAALLGAVIVGLHDAWIWLTARAGRSRR